MVYYRIKMTSPDRFSHTKISESSPLSDSQIPKKSQPLGKLWKEIASMYAGLAVGNSQRHIQNWVEQNYGPFDQNSWGYTLNYNSGDFPDGFLISSVADICLKYSIPNMPLRLRRAISSGLGISGVMVAETRGLQEFIVSSITHSGGDLSTILGNPDIHDRPAGFLGVACYLGVSLWLNRDRTKGLSQKPG